MKRLSDSITQLPITQNCDEFEDVIPVEDVKWFIRKLINKRTFKTLTKDEDVDSIIISVKKLKKLSGDALIGDSE